MDSVVSCLSLTLRRKVFVYEKEKQTEDKAKVVTNDLSE